MTHERNIVPHAKTQSVRIEQGPLQRRLRLADVHIDTPKGPVTLSPTSSTQRVARELTMTQLDRASRPARAAASASPVAQASRRNHRAKRRSSPVSAPAATSCSAAAARARFRDR